MTYACNDVRSTGREGYHQSIPVNYAGLPYAELCAGRVGPPTTPRPREIYHSYHFRPKYHQGIENCGSMRSELKVPPHRGRVWALRGFLGLR